MKNLTKSFLYAALAMLCWPLAAQNYNMQLRATMNFPGQTLANICGYTQNGKEYALVGGSKGLIIVDVTNPAAPQQIVQIPGPDNLWKEIKTYSHYAYVTSEGGQGVQIVDLSGLPSANLTYHHYTGDGVVAGQVNTIHALHIDEARGFLYLYGGGLFGGAGKVFNLNPDPYNPTYAGKFDQLGYIHDGFAYNDTLYAAHINAGILSIVDMSNKSIPVVLGTVSTPGHFTHNAWLLDDHKHILTTDEDYPSFVTSYDISNPEDIRELDRISTTVTGQNSIGHNTHVLNDWAITSWYTDGVTIVDAHRPDNLVEVGRYDTWPTPTDVNSPFEGCWGAYPFFPSGTIVTSNIEPGVMNILTPTYVRACYLEGVVYNGCNGAPLNGASIAINILDNRVNTTTNNLGIFKTGYVTPGNYTVTISKPGFAPQTIPFQFQTGVVTPLNVTLNPLNVFNLTGTVVDAQTGQPIGNARIKVTSPSETTEVTSAANGIFHVDCIAVDNYQATAAIWGYLPKTLNFINAQPLTLALQPGYYDDFQIDLGWEKEGTASTGDWVLGEPVGTTYQNNESNPDFDVDTDDGDQCYVTGNAGGGAANDDIDNGSVTLISPSMNLSSYPKANLSFYYWFFNEGGNSTPNDKFTVTVASESQSATVFTQNVSASEWRYSGIIPIQNFINLTDDTRVKFTAADDLPGHLVEAAVDVFKVEKGTVGVENAANAPEAMDVFPNPSTSEFHVGYAWEKATQTPELEVTNVLGQVVYTEQLNAKSGVITCGASWNPGVYFITLKSGDGGAVTQRVVKN